MTAAAPGLFLSFEGIEGAGKSTQARLCQAWVREQGREVVLVREPGGTPLSERLREVLLHGREFSWTAWAELCLYEAARAQLVSEVIRPALTRGAVVLADRYAEASVAYQGGGRQLGVARVRALNRWVTGDLRPGRVFLLDLDPETGLDRIRAGRGAKALDRLESEPLRFHRRVRSAYLRQAKREPDRFLVLDARLSEDALARQVIRSLRPWLRRSGAAAR
jgi:dTMP kinase